MHFEHPGAYDHAPAERLLGKHRAQSCPRQIHFGGIDLEIQEGVFAPDLTNTSTLMAACMDQYEFHPSWRVLDLFTGSGVFAIRVAKAGCRALGVDKEPSALACARRNVELNRVDGLVELRLGDGMSSLQPTEVFDFVVACPPLLPGSPTDSLEAAIVDPGLGATLGVIRGLRSHLTIGAPALVMFSDVFERIGFSIQAIAQESRLSVRPVLGRTLTYETYTVYEFQRT